MSVKTYYFPYPSDKCIYSNGTSFFDIVGRKHNLDAKSYIEIGTYCLVSVGGNTFGCQDIYRNRDIGLLLSNSGRKYLRTYLFVIVGGNTFGC